MKLYRGKLAGVFAGANGYYAAAMADDGVSHYQPAGGGSGWSAATLERVTAEARAMDDADGTEEGAARRFEEAARENERHGY